MKYLSFICAIAVAFSFASCKKNFKSLSRQQVNAFNEFINPPRTHVVVQTGDELYFWLDSTQTIKRLQTAPTPKRDLSLSPDGSQVAYIDTAGNVHQLGTINTNPDRLIAKLKGAKHIHWTIGGVLYGVMNDGKIAFQGTAMPSPNFDLQSEGGNVDELHDAIFLPNGEVQFSATYYRFEAGFINTTYGVYKWNPFDSTSTVLFEVMSESDLPKLLQSNKEGEVVMYRDSVATVQTRNGKNVDTDVFSGVKRVRTSVGAHINAAYITTHTNEIIVINNLRLTSYPNRAVDDTLRFPPLPVIDDFDIQMPMEDFPPASFTFN